MAYEPPRQRMAGQIVDVFVLLILTIGALYIPLYLELAGADKVPHPVDNPTWETLDQTQFEAQQWQALGMDPASANDIVTARFDYSFSWVALIVMAILVVGYFFLVVRLSDREYRDVVHERFGDGR